tara:strand:+ start:11516 stop:11737 length:222 start_codon:yes stop_codon:yes gene_type:complete
MGGPIIGAYLMLERYFYGIFLAIPFPKMVNGPSIMFGKIRQECSTTFLKMRACALAVTGTSITWKQASGLNDT